VIAITSPRHEHLMTYAFGPFELDVTVFELRRDGGTVPLQPKAFDLLVYLLERRDRVVARGELLQALWPGSDARAGTLSQALRAVRRALGDDGVSQRFVRTLRTRGVRFVAPLAG
jgi:DNA-binding winged helix-turn-helix (wHTH) protein